MPHPVFLRQVARDSIVDEIRSLLARRMAGSFLGGEVTYRDLQVPDRKRDYMRLYMRKYRKRNGK